MRPTEALPRSTPPWHDWRFEVIPRATPTPGGKAMTTTIRSRKVRRILRLESQAERQATREARAATRATLLQRRADALRTEARALEASLNGSQRAELGRVRAGAAVPAVRPSRCPVLHDEMPAAPTPQEV
jgi:hypothetical protein